MAQLKPTRAWLLPVLLVASSFVACSDDEAADPAEIPDGGQPATDAGPTADAASNTTDAGLDGGVAPPDAATSDVVVPANTLKACLDRPGELARPPSGELPCELLPPGFAR